MKKISLRSILFTSYTVILAVLYTAYMGDKAYLLNFYILPILFGAYYFNIYGGIGIALLSSALSLLFMHNAGNAINDTYMFTYIVVFVIVGVIAGIFQRENDRLNNYMLHAALTDKLTGLYNYGYFKKRIDEEISRAERYNHSLALIMIDIDFFKKYNDAYGHERGNQAISKTAQIFLNISRKADIVFRYGGDEFAVILPETGEDVLEIAERLRQGIEQEIFPGNVRLSVSSGSTYYPYSKSFSANIVEQADKALYEAKKNGINKVCIYRG